MTEKERFTNRQSARAWRCYFLSTSNLSLTQFGHRGGIVIDEAERSRLADLPLPEEGHGIYETLHGFADGAALSDELQRRSWRYFGTASRECVRQLVREGRTDRQGLPTYLKDKRGVYLKALNAQAKAENLPAAQSGLWALRHRFRCRKLGDQIRNIAMEPEEALGGDPELPARWLAACR